MRIQLKSYFRAHTTRMSSKYKLAWSSVLIVILATSMSTVLALNPPDVTQTIKNSMKPHQYTSLYKTNVEASVSGQQDTTISSPPTQPASPQATQPEGFGIAVGDLGWLPYDIQLARMDSFVDLGVKWIRFDVSWADLQPVKGQPYNRSSFDRLVQLAKERDINLLPILMQTPEWARNTSCTEAKQCQPADPNTFATFAKDMVSLYSSQGIHTWEIWNEPNKQESWKPIPSSAAYTLLLKATYTAIKSQDPSAVVITGGVGSVTPGTPDIDPLAFVSTIYSLGGKPYFDAIGDHPYSYPVASSYKAPWNAWQRVDDTSDSLRAIMLNNDDTGKKVWITEYGAPTGGVGAVADIGNYNLENSPKYVTEALQASMVSDVIKEYRNRTFYGPLFWYTYQDRSFDTSTRENFFGLVRADGTRKPAYDTYKQLVKDFEQ